MIALDLAAAARVQVQQPAAQRATIQFEGLRAPEGGVDGAVRTALELEEPELRVTVEAVALHELRSHAYLGGGLDLQQTVFSSGGGEARVTINTDTAPFVTGDGLEVPARGVVIEQTGELPRRGAIETTARWREAP